MKKIIYSFFVLVSVTCDYNPDLKLSNPKELLNLTDPVDSTLSDNIEDDIEKQNLTLELITSLGFVENLKKDLTVHIDQSKLNPMVKSKLHSRLRVYVQSKFYPEIEKILITKFSEEELKAITDFFNSNAGQKFQNLSLDLNRELHAIQDWHLRNFIQFTESVLEQVQKGSDQSEEQIDWDSLLK